MRPFMTVFSSIFYAYFILLNAHAEELSLKNEVQTEVIETPTDSLQLSEGKKSLGKKSNFSITLGANALNTGVLNEWAVKLFGKDLSIIEAAAKSTYLKESEVELTLAGMKVFHDKGEFKNGAYHYSAGLPTTHTRVKVAALPVGPVMVQVDAGVAFEADLDAKVAPFFSIPIEFTTLNTSLSANAAASGFIEGYAQFLFLRAGVGGQLNLIHGNTAIDANLGINKLTRTLNFSGFISTLYGKIYGFADVFTLLKGNWKRIWEPRITDWKGLCYSLETQSQSPCQTAMNDNQQP